MKCHQCGSEDLRLLNEETMSVLCAACETLMHRKIRHEKGRWWNGLAIKGGFIVAIVPGEWLCVGKKNEIKLQEPSDV